MRDPPGRTSQSHHYTMDPRLPFPAPEKRVVIVLSDRLAIVLLVLVSLIVLGIFTLLALALRRPPRREEPDQAPEPEQAPEDQLDSDGRYLQQVGTDILPILHRLRLPGTVEDDVSRRLLL